VDLATLEGERKIVTVMFAEIAGFTTLAESLDLEQVRSLMNSCFEALVPVVEKYFGAIDKLVGDAILALFGAPVTHKNDPEQALRAALEMKEVLASLNSARGTDLELHFKDQHRPGGRRRNWVVWSTGLLGHGGRG
jgi:class 3 adenylate cyclase